MTRRRFTSSAAALAIVPAFAPGLMARTPPRPNMIFIMADDLGYADLSCYGRRDYQTPHCDRLAEEGARFLQAYANSPVCSATRTALITGRYQYRLPVGLEEPLQARPVGLPPEHSTMPSLLRDAGYRTALIGKWHLGSLPDYGPLKSGYDTFFGFRGGGVDYFSHRGLPGNPDLWDGDHPVEQSGYLTDLLGNRTVSTIEEFAGSEQPFFISLHFSAPHWPWEDGRSDAESRRLSSIDDPLALVHFDGGSMATYAAMVRSMDDQVGRVLETLDRLGIADETIVVFTSDNGGERFSDTWPFTGVKTELLEGGIRVPALVRWPGKIAAGVDCDQVAMSMDWLPTFLGAAGVSCAEDYPTDGIDLFANLSDPPIRRTLFWRYQHLLQEACRDGDLKYLKIDGNEFLFDLSQDPRERANLNHRQPEEFAQLKQLYADWEATMLPRDPEAFTHGFEGSNLADHFGVK